MNKKARLDDTIEQLRAARAFVSMAQDTDEYSQQERNGFLAFAVMHACQASIYGDMNLFYGMSIHDYKHKIITAVKAVMNGTPTEEAAKAIGDYPRAASINWDYYAATTQPADSGASEKA